MQDAVRLVPEVDNLGESVTEQPTRIKARETEA